MTALPCYECHVFNNRNVLRSKVASVFRATYEKWVKVQSLQAIANYKEKFEKKTAQNDKAISPLAWLCKAI